MFYFNKMEEIETILVLIVLYLYSTDCIGLWNKLDLKTLKQHLPSRQMDMYSFRHGKSWKPESKFGEIYQD